MLVGHVSDDTFIRDVDTRLRMYGDSRHDNKSNPIDELVFIILSAQTESYTYRATYEALRARYPEWSDILEASEDEVANAIERGGLANKKARQIRAALGKIADDFGSLTLTPLDQEDDVSAEHYLTSLPGVGVKTAKCILMYSFHRSVFPVDTHVWRICRRLALTPPVPKPTPRQERALEQAIPVDVRYTLHVNLVSHGQMTCLTYWPHCARCILTDICPSSQRQDVVWGKWRKPKGAWAHAVSSASVQRQE